MARAHGIASGDDAGIEGRPRVEGHEVQAPAAGSVNRDLTAVRAALNYALAEGLASSSFAWSEPLKAIPNADGRRALYLDRAERRSLIAHASPDVARFLTGLALVPLSPGALAALTVQSFDTTFNVLAIGRDKAGRDRKIELPSTSASFFKSAVDGRALSAPLLARADGSAWNKDAWKQPVKRAAAAAGLHPQTTAYTVRHSVITDLVAGGLDLLTTAQLSGTSVAMIERHYGHLLRKHATNALAGLVL